MTVVSANRLPAAEAAMRGDAPAVTVLLPIWDAEAYLAEALDSVDDESRGDT